MKIVMVHNKYQQSGGEDQVFLNEIELLRNYNEEVLTYVVDNNEIKSTLKSKLEVGIKSVWSYTEYQNFKLFLQKNRPDIVHVHNFFPLISPSLFYVCDKLNIPVVQTLHNYRLICPAANFLRNNEICEKCLNGSLLNSVKHGCYRNSSVQTIPVATMIAVNRVLKTWEKKVDKFIALTDFSKLKFIESGIPAEKISVKSNFAMKKNVDDLRLDRENFMLFVGRLSKEKGLDILLESWKEYDNPKKVQLVIAGNGPEKVRLEEMYGQDETITFKGKLNQDEILDLMKKTMYLFVPSINYEGFPMTILEAYSVGTPVIASDIGAMKEVVKDQKTGFHFLKGNKSDLISTIQKAVSYSNYESLILNVKKEFNDRYTSDINYSILRKIYEEARLEKEKRVLVEST